MRETAALAEYAVGLSYDDIPNAVVQRAKECIIDTVAVSVFGATLPWSRIISGYAARSGGEGHSTILGPDLPRTTAPFAALANGALAHAFEMDSLRHPSAGIHPGAALAVPGLAVAEGSEASGRELIRAFVAGSEVLSRLGQAGRHTSEQLGFHAPGLTGPFGSAVVTGCLLGLDDGEMLASLGIAGSLSSGILEFVRSGTGGMVKRLHLGRAAESGVLAASLAADGFEGPVTVFEGEYGFLEVFCSEPDVSLLTAGLGESFETLNICLKRFACHITAHTPVQAILDMRAEHGFEGSDVARVTVRGSAKMVSHHDIPEPADSLLAQYSTQFCVAVAAHRNPLDPRSFMGDALYDEAIRDLCRRVRIELRTDTADPKTWASLVEVELTDGRTIEKAAESFPGMPTHPLSAEQLRDRFDRLTEGMELGWSDRVADALFDLENVGNVAELF